jgi:mannose-6-phosphate isomerase-like protein (cupin superfamily)
MNTFHVTHLQQQLSQQTELYLEFLRVPALSVGLYELAAGSADAQQPHTEDEVYYVVSGQGMIRVGDENQLVAAGSIVYVPAYVDHKFHSITADLSVIVFFAPAEGSTTATPS